MVTFFVRPAKRPYMFLYITPINTAKFFGQLVTVLMEFHCVEKHCQVDSRAICIEISSRSTSHLSLRWTPLGPALAVHLREMSVL